MGTSNRIIQVPIDEPLLRQLDKLSRQRRQSRAAVIREACAKYVASARDAELERRYIEGYRRFPESTVDSAERVKLAGEVWGEEEWSDEDFLGEKG
jgi:predicted transcriptional regulator